MKTIAFINESGSINQRDPNPISSLVAVCMPERVHRGVSRSLYSIRRRILGDDDRELKAIELIKRGSFERAPRKVDLVNEVFNLVSGIDVVVFAIAVPRPTRPLDTASGYLPTPHKFLVQRINALAEEQRKEAILVYDGNGMNIQGMNMSLSISDYIFKVAERHNILRRIVDTALFVDSRVTPGIQIADLIASVVRQYEHNNLGGGFDSNNGYLSFVNTLYNSVRGKTRNDIVDDYGNRLYGFYRMREEQLYPGDEGNTNEDESE